MAIDEEITLKKLECFLTFMKVSNLARASELLGQSTVSVHRALHSLEEGLGCQLFKREGRNLIPLKTAYIFAEYAKQAVVSCEEGIRKVRDAVGFNAAHLKIGALYSLTLHCVPRIVVGMKLRKPALDINLTTGSNQSLLEGLADGNVDAIIIGLIEELANKDLVSVPLFEDTMYLTAPIGSPYARHTEIDLREMEDEKFVALSSGFVTAQSFYKAFEPCGFKPRIAMEVGDIFSLINLVSEGVGYGLLPGRIGMFSPRIQLIPLAAPYASRQSITLLFPKIRERDPNLLALSAECRMYALADTQG